MASLSLKNINKVYPNGFHAVKDFNLEIEDKEFIIFVGPSGCGKSTTLRMIAGLEEISSGELWIGDKLVNDVEPKDRDIAMVFQNYALYPHMTVLENVMFPLTVGKNKKPKSEAMEIAKKYMAITSIEELANKKPGEMSGGQQQRVAITRALVQNPRILLLDEPLSNLDARLRLKIREEIRRLVKEIGITTIFVTHDQEEALAISDRIAVMKEGVVQHVGTPKEIYTRPKNVFVSTFIGHSNLYKGTIEIKNEGTFVKFEKGYTVKMDNLKGDLKNGQKVIIAVRPEEFIISNKGLLTKVKTATFLGRYTNYEIIFDDSELLEGQAAIELSQDIGTAERIYNEGDSLFLEVNPKKINVFTEDGEENLIKGSEN